MIRKGGDIGIFLSLHASTLRKRRPEKVNDQVKVLDIFLKQLPLKVIDIKFHFHGGGDQSELNNNYEVGEKLFKFSDLKKFINDDDLLVQ